MIWNKSHQASSLLALALLIIFLGLLWLIPQSALASPSSRPVNPDPSVEAFNHFPYSPVMDVSARIEQSESCGAGQSQASIAAYNIPADVTFDSASSYVEVTALSGRLAGKSVRGNAVTNNSVDRGAGEFPNRQWFSFPWAFVGEGIDPGYSGARCSIRYHIAFSSVPSSLADLTVAGVFWSPAAPRSGDQVRFTVRVSNLGDQAGDSFTASLYLDGDRKSDVIVGQIPAGGSQEAQFDYYWTATPGSHSVMGMADLYHRLSESDESNNSLTLPLNVAAPPPEPDLVISNISWSPISPSSGDTVTISYTVENRGGGPSPDFGSGLSIDGGAVTVSARQSLAAGQARTQKFYFDWRPAPGPHTITVQADWEGAIAETDEANNSLTRSLSVGAPPSSPASLSVLNSPIKTMEVLRYRFSGFQPNGKVNVYVLGGGGVTNDADAAGNGTASFLNGDPPGRYTLVAEDHAGHRATATFQIAASGPVPVTLRVPEAVGRAGQSVRLKASINGEDLASLPHPLSGQTLQFFVNDASVGAAVSDGFGEAIVSYTPLLSGFFSIKVVYAGNDKYQAASATGTLRAQSQPLPTISGLTPNSGPPSGGTRVAIRGSGFMGANSVRFGSSPAQNFAVVSDQEIIATSPATAPGVVEVQVATTAGRSGPCVAIQICAAAFTFQNRTNVELTVVDVSGKAGETVTLRAALKGMVAAPEGIPLSGQEIRFYVGDSRVGIVTTSAGGEASVRYVPASAGAFQVRVEYPGNDKYKAATATARLQVEAPSAPPAAPPGTGRLPGEVDVIWGWDPQQQMWQIYVASVPLLSDLNKLEYGHSYFFHAAGPVSFSYGGNTYSFVVGWNLTAWLGPTTSIP